MGDSYTAAVTFQRTLLVLVGLGAFWWIYIRIYHIDQSSIWLKEPIPRLLKQFQPRASGPIQYNPPAPLETTKQKEDKQTKQSFAGNAARSKKDFNVYINETTSRVIINKKNIVIADSKTQNNNASKELPSALDTTGKTTTRFMLGLPWQRGRLGNQMFQYAALLGIAAKQNRIPWIVPGCMMATLFEVTPEYVFLPDETKEETNFAKWQPLTDEVFGKFDKTLFEPLSKEHLKLRGFTQSYKYFHDIRSDIRKEFRFNVSISRDANMLFKKIVAADVKIVTVGIHVRRGDFLNGGQIMNGRLTPSKSYFDKAMKYFRDKYKQVKFLVTSEGKGWAKQNILGDDVAIVPAASAEVHMAVLCLCRHMIQSAGTYGFWPAYLTAEEVIYYTPPYRKGSNLANGSSIEDFYLPTWMGMGD